jgi:hypothetical protein
VARLLSWQCWSRLKALNRFEARQNIRLEQESLDTRTARTLDVFAYHLPLNSAITSKFLPTCGINQQVVWPSNIPMSLRGQGSHRRLAPTAIAGMQCGACVLVGLFNFHSVSLCGGAYPLPGGTTFRVRDALHLIEACDRIAHVRGVFQRLLSLLGESELSCGYPITSWLG